jgi:ethanolamine ammonia-lyase small subunit
VSEESLQPTDPLQAALARTPARLLMGRAGTHYRTSTFLKLREDHAAARDAVATEFDLITAFGPERSAQYQLFLTKTLATDKSEYLMRPDLGRKFDESSRQLIAKNCPRETDLQIVVGDGLSSQAVTVQAPALLEHLFEKAKAIGWTLGRPFVVQYCRVGLMNEIGELLRPKVVVLLIGERPGLATAESLSAYLAYQPRTGHTDAHRNLISNIHAQGVPLEEAANRLLGLAQQFCEKGESGVRVKELRLESGFIV